MVEHISGRVLAVCLSDKRTFPKFPQPSVIVGEFGIEGDAHAGEFRPRQSDPTQFVPNKRQVSVVSEQMRRRVSQAIGQEITAGGFNENVLVDLELDDLVAGDSLVFESGVRLEVTKQNLHCPKLDAFYDADISPHVEERDDSGKLLRNMRGIVAVVRAIGTLSPGESFTIERVSV